MESWSDIRLCEMSKTNDRDLRQKRRVTFLCLEACYPHRSWVQSGKISNKVEEPMLEDADHF